MRVIDPVRSGSAGLRPPAPHTGRNPGRTVDSPSVTANSELASVQAVCCAPQRRSHVSWRERSFPREPEGGETAPAGPDVSTNRVPRGTGPLRSNRVVQGPAAEIARKRQDRLLLFLRSRTSAVRQHRAGPWRPRSLLREKATRPAVTRPRSSRWHPCRGSKRSASASEYSMSLWTVVSCSLS